MGQRARSCPIYTQQCKHTQSILYVLQSGVYMSVCPSVSLGAQGTSVLSSSSGHIGLDHVTPFCPFFKTVFSFFDVELYELFIYFLILTPYQSCHLQIVCPIQQVVFSFCRWFPFVGSFKFNEVPFVCFCFCFLCLQRQIQKNIAMTYVKGCSDYVFFQEFYGF